MELVFATNNKHKFEEIQYALDTSIKLLNLNDLNFHEEIPEEKDTIEGNAIEKAHFIYNKFGKNCFADDTGLEIDALNGEPGVYSARYAGKNCSFEDNMNKVLSKMKGISNRKAQFRTVIALILNGDLFTFEGKIEGLIMVKKTGEMGFGYDPIFKPNGYSKTFAEMNMMEKNLISHRAIAINKLTNYILKLNKK